MLDDLGNWTGESAWPTDPNTLPGFYRGDDLDGDGVAETTYEVAHDTDLANQITQTQTALNGGAAAAQTFIYDRAGNLVFDGRFFYQYDAFNRLVLVSTDPALSAATFDADGRPTVYSTGNRRRVAAFEYDGLGRLVRTTRTRPTSGNDQPQVEDYYYDGVRRIQERQVTGSWEAWDDPNGVVRDYVWGPGYVDEVLTQVSRTGTGTPTVYTYLQDAAYNVVAILGSLGETQRQYVFEPYGEVVFSETAGGDPNLLPVNRIGHQGLFFERFLLDPNDTFATPALDPNAVGVYLTRNRPYSPRLGRWLSRDMNESAQPVVTALAMNGQSLGILFGAFSALGHYADGMNLFEAYGSNPVNRRDPLGLYYDPFEDTDEIIGAMYAENVAFGQDMLNSFGFLAKTGAFIGQMAIESMIVAMVPGGAFIVAGYHIAHTGMDMYKNGVSFSNSFEMVASAVPFAQGLVKGFRGGLAALRAMRAPRGCFVAGTLVWMAGGTLVPIEQVRTGDEVVTRGCDIGQVEPARVLATHMYEATSTLRICVSDEMGCLTVTAEHPFWVEGSGWAPAGNLRVGDRLSDAAGSSTAISAITIHIGATTVYNLSVGGSQTYFVTPELLLVHNKPRQNGWVSRGSTGRWQPANLSEQLAMDAAKADPAAGRYLDDITMSDPRWPAGEGWQKMQQNVNGIIIHYVWNPILNVADDFKFK